MYLKRLVTKSMWIEAALLTITILAVHSFTLMRFPTPHGDEAWMASRAWEFVHSGSSFGALDRGVLDRFDGYRSFYPWLPTAIQSLGIRLFGGPSLLAIRFVSMVAGFVLLCAVYGIGFALDGKRLGLFGVAFTAFSFPFFFSTHLGRPDVIAAAFGFSAIALYLNNRSARIFLSSLAGLLAALAFEVHAHAVIYGPTLVVLLLLKYKWSLFRKADFRGFIAGTLAGLAFYFGLHIMPSPQTFWRLNQLVFSATHIPPILSFDLSIILDAFKQMAFMVFWVYPPVVIGLWAIIRFLRKRNPSYGTILALNAVLLISFTLLVRNKLTYYAILYTPVLCLLLAAFFYDFLQLNTKTRAEHRIRQFIVIGVCVFPLFFILRFNSLPGYQRVQRLVNQAVAPTEVIMANQLYWFELWEHRYYSWENLVYYRRYMPGSSLEDAFQSLKPDIFIIDYQVDNFILDKKSKDIYRQEFSVPKLELESFLDQHAKLVKIDTYENRPLHIYRIDWESQE